MCLFSESLARKSGVSSARSIPPSAPGLPPPGQIIGGAPSDEASIGAIHASVERTQPEDQNLHFSDGKKRSARRGSVSSTRRRAVLSMVSSSAI
ncbi:hypothetical protein DFH11DRAFT_1630312 [Phellopilus nigrolimitatus]|nr:hypothetical protein DFH11DRAFT_1630312 [Phellopilus nigrolimitatus]